MTSELSYQRLGSFEILDRLGAGAMGEVYRARDTKLGREVAIKVLPDVFAADTDRLARFEREARVLASINHPNIAAIHELGNENHVHFLVLELVGGRTLEDCPEIYGDRIEQVVRWKDGSDLGKWTGKTVRLKVQMKDADLYSIRFR